MSGDIVRAKSILFTPPQAEEFIFVPLLFLFPKVQGTFGSPIAKNALFHRISPSLPINSQHRQHFHRYRPQCPVILM